MSYEKLASLIPFDRLPFPHLWTKQDVMAAWEHDRSTRADVAWNCREWLKDTDLTDEERHVFSVLASYALPDPDQIGVRIDNKPSKAALKAALTQLENYSWRYGGPSKFREKRTRLPSGGVDVVWRFVN